MFDKATRRVLNKSRNISQNVKKIERDDGVRFFDFEKSQIPSRLDFEILLAKQIDRILFSYSSGYDEQFIRSVRALELSMSPYFDKRYNSSIKEIEETEAIRMKRGHPSEREARRNHIATKISLRKYTELMKLMSRRALIPERSITENL